MACKIGGVRDKVSNEEQSQHSIQTAKTLAGKVSSDLEDWILRIRSSASSIAENLIPTSGAHSDALRILGVCDNTQASIRRLKSIARVYGADNSSDKKKLKVINVNSCIMDAVKSVVPEYDDKKVLLNIEHPSRPFLAKIDHTAMSDVVVAILSNALQASKYEDVVSIDTIQRSINKVPHVVVRIRDSGHGMTKEVKNRIFEPFFTTRDRDIFLGLGLTVAAKAIASCNGFIRVRSQPNRGASFSIFVPLEESRRMSSKIPDQPKTEIILTIDDTVESLEFSRTVLQKEGYSILDAGTTRDALSLLDTNISAMNLCIIDLTIPSTQTEQILTVLADEVNPMPVILTSGFSRDYARGQLKGFSFSFLQKPFSDIQLLSAVRKALDRSAQSKSRPGGSSLI